MCCARIYRHAVTLRRRAETRATLALYGPNLIAAVKSADVETMKAREEGPKEDRVATIERALLPYVRQFASFQPESWKADHEQAMRCLELEVVLQMGCSLYEQLRTADESWRIRMARGEVEYDATVDAAFDKLFDIWLSPGALVLEEIAELEAAAYEVEHADTFRRYHAQCAAARQDRD